MLEERHEVLLLLAGEGLRTAMGWGRERKEGSIESLVIASVCLGRLRQVG